MVKNTKDINLISFVLKLEVEKWNNFNYNEANLAKAIFCEKKLNEGFKKLGFEFEKQPDMQFDVKCDKQCENILKKATYFFDFTSPNYKDECNELYIQLYFKATEKIENIKEELKKSLEEIINEKLEKQFLELYDDQTRFAEYKLIRSASLI